MMQKWRGYFLVMAVVVIIVTVGLAAQLYLDRTADSLASALVRVGRAIARSDWPRASADFASLEAEWTKTRRNWALYIDHQEIDQVEVRLARLKELIRYHDRSGAMAEHGEALMLIRHLPERERLTWRNLF